MESSQGLVADAGDEVRSQALAHQPAVAHDSVRLRLLEHGLDMPGEGLIQSGGLLRLRLLFSLSQQALRDLPLDYTATVYAKDLGSGKRQPIGQSHGRLTSAEPQAVTVVCTAPESGLYRLETTVGLSLPLPDLQAQITSGLVQII